MEFYVNGVRVAVAHPDPAETLASYLRQELQLTGCKVACGEGGCGACTVMVSAWDRASSSARHWAVNACLAPLCSVDGMAVTTVEGIGSITTRLHPIQEALIKAHGTQCGFCTPGIVMSFYAFLRNNPHPRLEDILRAFDGNLCRCTGYRPILQGFSAFASTASGGGGDCCSANGNGGCPCKEAQQREAANGHANGHTNGHADSPTETHHPTNGHHQPTNGHHHPSFTVPHPTQEVIFPPALILQAGKPRASKTFTTPTRVWHSPVSLEEVLTLLHHNPHAKLLGGNTEVGVEVMVRQVRPSAYIFLGHVPEINALQATPGKSGVTLGALRLFLLPLSQGASEVESSLAKAILKALHYFAGSQIRAVATVGGNLSNASPISDLNPIWVATNANIDVASGAATRSIPAREFFLGYRRTALRVGEVVVAIRVPRQPSVLVSWFKQSRRRDDDIAIVNACFALKLEAGCVTAFDAAFGGMAPITVHAATLASRLSRQSWSPALIDMAHAELASAFSLDHSTPGGMPIYRMSLAMGFFTKFFWQAQAAFYGKDTVPSALQLLLQDETQAASTFKSTQVYDPLALQEPSEKEDLAPVGKSAMHRSAAQQSTGEAKYLDDYPRMKNELQAALVLSSRAHAKIRGIDTAEALGERSVTKENNGSVASKTNPHPLALDGVFAVYTANDIPGKRVLGPIVEDEEPIAATEVGWIGQCVAIVVASTKTAAEEAAKLVRVLYDDLPAVLTIPDAVAADSYHARNIRVEDGDVAAAFAQSPHTLTGDLEIGGQEHFYFEPQGCLAIPSGEGEMELLSSTQQPSGAQTMVAQALNMPSNRVRCIVKRIGGGFGGKESRAALVAVMAAVAAHHARRPVRLILPRNVDMLWSGGRNPFAAHYRAAFDGSGVISAVNVSLALNAGWTADLSVAVMEKAVLHLDGCYRFANYKVVGSVCKTNLASNTAFRGFGAPQAMLVVETIVDAVAKQLGLPPHEVRAKNFYKNGDATPYGQPMVDCQAQSVWGALMDKIDLAQREKAIGAFNAANACKKRGLAVLTTKFGVGYEPTAMNQANAQVHLLLDGSVQLIIGGVEMGQGLYTKMIQVAATALNLPLSAIHISRTNTETAVNEVPTAASLSSDRFGLAVVDACRQLNERLEPYRKKLPKASFAEIVQAAWNDRVQVMALGFGKIENMHFDFATMRGCPYAYFCFGAACSEVEVDTLTGDCRILRSDLVMDVGKPLNPKIDIGQIEGAFLQGVGLFTMEQKVFLSDGRDITVGPGAYKIPSFLDIPEEFNVHLLRYAPQQAAVHSSKAIGEPPLFLGASVYFAIREAVAAHRRAQGAPQPDVFRLDSPATCERIRLLCSDGVVEQLNSKAPSSNKTPWALQHV